MESVIDIEALVAPISDDSPSGTDPRENSGFDSPYNRLKDARETAMSSERPNKSAQPEDGDSSPTIDVATWANVVEEASGILKEQGKDLEVCALLIEGLARVHGPAGIRDGFLVTASILDQYWDTLFPVLDPNEEDSLEDRLAAFSGLNGVGQPGTLATYIAKIPVTDTGFDNFRNYDYERAWNTSSIPDLERREEQLAKLGFSLEDIEKASRETPIEYYVDLSSAVKASLEALTTMDQCFTTACGHEAPPTSMIAEALTRLSDVINYLAGDRLRGSPAEDDRTAGEEIREGATVPAPAGGGPGSIPAGAIANRDDAIARLRTVANYFRDTEPHSPLSYSLQNVIRWAQLPLDKLIEEWISDSDARERYMLMTGMRSSKSSEEDQDY